MSDKAFLGKQWETPWDGKRGRDRQTRHGSTRTGTTSHPGQTTAGRAWPRSHCQNIPTGGHTQTGIQRAHADTAGSGTSFPGPCYEQQETQQHGSIYSLTLAGWELGFLALQDRTLK